MERTPSQEWWLKFFNGVLYDALAPAYDSLDWLTLGAWWRLVRRALLHPVRWACPGSWVWAGQVARPTCSTSRSLCGS